MDSNSLKQYLIDPSQFIVTNGGVVRAELAKADSIIKSPQGIQKIIEVNKVERVCKKITFTNGNVSLIDLKSSLVGPDGYPLPVGQVKPDQYIQFSFYNFFPGKEQYVQIEWTDKKMAIPIRIPKEMNEDFAYWLGIVAAKGKTGIGQRSLMVELNRDTNLEEVFTALTKKIFNLTVDKRTYDGRSFLRINSSNLVQYIQTFLGRRLLFKKPPIAIIESNIVVQLAFIRGLAIKGFMDKKQVVIFSGTSKYMADFVTAVLTSVGYGIHRREKKGKKTVYILHLQYWHPHATPLFVDFIDFKHAQNHKQQYIKLPLLEDLAKLQEISLEEALVSYAKCNYLVEAAPWVSLVGKNQSREFRIGKAHPGYKTISKAKEKKALVINASSIQDVRAFSEAVHLIQVKSVEIVRKEMIEITTSTSSGIILDGLIIL